VLGRQYCVANRPRPCHGYSGNAGNGAAIAPGPPGPSGRHPNCRRRANHMRDSPYHGFACVLLGSQRIRAGGSVARREHQACPLRNPGQLVTRVPDPPPGVKGWGWSRTSRRYTACTGRRDNSRSFACTLAHRRRNSSPRHNPAEAAGACRSCRPSSRATHGIAGRCSNPRLPCMALSTDCTVSGKRAARPDRARSDRRRSNRRRKRSALPLAHRRQAHGNAEPPACLVGRRPSFRGRRNSRCAPTRSRTRSSCSGKRCPPDCSPSGCGRCRL
jgi:hypothetical protein